MVSYQDTLWCDGCGVEISWEPVFKDKLIYCCKSCSRREKCDCEVPEDEYSTPGSDSGQTLKINS